MDEKDLLSVRNFGRKSYDELRAQLINHGYMEANKPIGPFAGSAFSDEAEGEGGAGLLGIGDEAGDNNLEEEA